MVKVELVPVEQVERLIRVLRGQRVILDADLAALYGVKTSNLNQAVSRNVQRFPDDFMLQMTLEEFRDLKFQFGTSRWGGTRKAPRAFTEQGVAMLSSVLRSPRAVQVNIEIHAGVRAPAPDARSKRGAGEEARSTREEV